MSSFPWEIGRCVHLVHMLMWPRSDGAEQWSPSLAEPHSPFAPDSTWPRLSFLPGLLALWAFEFLTLLQPHPPWLLLFLLPPNRKVRPERGAYRLCNWPCPPLTLGLLPARNSFLQISAQGVRSAVGGLGALSAKFFRRTQRFIPVQWCHSLSKLNVVGLLQGASTQRRNLISEMGTFPDREGSLRARKIQGESDWGFKHLVLDH